MTGIRCLAPALSGILLLSLSPRTCAQTFPLKEYEVRVNHYLASLENLAFDVTTTDHALDGSVTIQTDYAVISIPGHFRVKATQRFTEKGGRKTSKTQWVLLRPDGYYVIEEKAEGQFVLKEMGKASSPLIVDGAALSALSVLTRPVCDGRLSLLHLLRGDFAKDGHVRKAIAFRKHSGNTGTASTLRAALGVTGDLGEAEYELDDGWLIRRSTTTSRRDAGRWKTTEITYTQLGERTLPSRVTDKLSIDVSKLPSPVMEYRNYRVYNGSPRDFSLTQFGLPEPMGASSIYQPQSRWYLWFLALAASSFVFGGYLWHRGRRRKARLSQHPS